jgi:hypothetical protein
MATKLKSFEFRNKTNNQTRYAKFLDGNIWQIGTGDMGDSPKKFEQSLRSACDYYGMNLRFARQDDGTIIMQATRREVPKA